MLKYILFVKAFSIASGWSVIITIINGCSSRTVRSTRARELKTTTYNFICTIQYNHRCSMYSTT